MSQVPNLKYKTSLCNSWQQGNNCHKGESCFFAHGQNELRSLEQNKQEIARRNQQIREISQKSEGNTNYKTIYCKFYQRGECKLGDHCTFIHEKRQKRKRSENISRSQVSVIAPVQDLSWHQYSDYCWMMNKSQVYGKFYFNSLSQSKQSQKPLSDSNSQKNSSSFDQHQESINTNMHNSSPKQALLSN